MPDLSYSDISFEDLPLYEVTASLSNIELHFGSSLPAPTLPTIANFVPTVGNSIYPSTPIQFDVTDVDGVQSVVVLCLFPDGTYEVVFDSASFAAPYVSASTVSTVTNGLRFVLRRTEGWIGSPSIRVLATDNLSAITPL